MGDFYTEQLLKKKTVMTDVLIKIGMIAATVLSFFSIFIIPFAILIPVIFIAADVYVFRMLDLEYEYLYFNGDLDIDKIMSKSSRKRVFEVNMKDVEIVAPVGSDALRPFDNIRAKDYSSREAGRKLYKMVILTGGKKSAIIFEPNEAVLQGMQMISPRKVYF